MLNFHLIQKNIRKSEIKGDVIANYTMTPLLVKLKILNYRQIVILGGSIEF